MNKKQEIKLLKSYLEFHYNQKEQIENQINELEQELKLDASNVHMINHIEYFALRQKIIINYMQDVIINEYMKKLKELEGSKIK